MIKPDHVGFRINKTWVELSFYNIEFDKELDKHVEYAYNCSGTRKSENQNEFSHA